MTATHEGVFKGSKDHTSSLPPSLLTLPPLLLTLRSPYLGNGGEAGLMNDGVLAQATTTIN